jgi:hypothetical protein
VIDIFNNFDFKTAIKLNRLLIIVLLIAAVGFALSAKDTTQINIMSPGLKIQLGNSKGETTTTIKLQGTYTKSLVSGAVFSGKITIDDSVYICSKSKSTVETGVMVTQIKEGKTIAFGNLFFDEAFTQFALLLNGWNNESGIMIIAPAVNRTEAMDISNEILKPFLESNTLNPLN